MSARRVAAAVLTLPLVELVVAIAVGRTLGVLPAVLMILAGMVLGVVVLNREGSGAVADLQAAQRTWQTAGSGPTVATPGRRPADRLLVVLAGVLLLVPGLVSDVVGLLLLVPAVRRLVRGRAGAAARRRGWTMDAGGTGRVISSDGLPVTDITVTDITVTDLRPTGRGTAEGPGPALGPGPSRS